ncbi:type VII secretion protein EccE [Dactylosporangium sp. CA-092794]|uniref:type VII secretion protein EccE n=1 Tax=Dactylosporangium sp. CA-092794 TaxID=3239929 RepID=UPI003D935628
MDVGGTPVAAHPAPERESIQDTGRGPGYAGPFHLVQLLVVQGAVVLVVLAASHPTAASAGGAAAAVAMVAAVLTRLDKRWMVERIELRWRLGRRHRWERSLRRARGGSVNGVTEPGRLLLELRRVAPGLSVGAVTGSDGVRIGVGRDGEGWFAAAVMQPSAPMRDDPRPSLPTDELLSLIEEAACPGAVLQVVTHTVPAQGGAAAPNRQPPDRSGPIPIERVTWIVVRLDARSLAVLGADPARTAGQADAVVATLIRRQAKALRDMGLTTQVLDPEGLLAALAHSVGLDRPAAAADLREHWISWPANDLAHATFWIREWPPPQRIGRLLDALAVTPATLTSVAITMTADGDDALVRCLVRVAAPRRRLSQVCAAVVGVARADGAGLSRLDGQHAPAVYASAPTGGSVR